MAATTFGVRYPSMDSPGKFIYAKGGGVEDTDPYTAILRLANNNYYFFYVKFFRATGESGITVKADLHNPVLQDWFPLLSYDQENPQELNLAGIENDIKKYRIPFSPYYSQVSMSPAEDLIKLMVSCDGTQAGGWAQVVVITSNSPTYLPHVTDGYTRIPVGSIKINIEDDLGGWKILHEDTFRASQESALDLGVGAHLITFDEVGGKTPPVDQFVDVTGGQVTEINVSYT